MIEIQNNQSIETVEKIGDKKPIIPDQDNFNESMIFQKKMSTIEERVKSILRSDKYARKKDWWLILLYWVKMGYIKIVVPLENLNKITPPESITRVKRRLISMAKKGDKELRWLLNDLENIQIREEHEQLYHNYYADKKSQEIAGVVK